MYGGLILMCGWDIWNLYIIFYGALTVKWPPLLDLTLLDIFLWSRLKNVVCAKTSTTREVLKARVGQAIQNITTR